MKVIDNHNKFIRFDSPILLAATLLCKFVVVAFCSCAVGVAFGDSVRGAVGVAFGSCVDDADGSVCGSGVRGAVVLVFCVSVPVVSANSVLGAVDVLSDAVDDGGHVVVV